MPGGFNSPRRQQAFVRLRRANAGASRRAAVRSSSFSAAPGCARVVWAGRELLRCPDQERGYLARQVEALFLLSDAVPGVVQPVACSVEKLSAACATRGPGEEAPSSPRREMV